MVFVVFKSKVWVWCTAVAALVLLTGSSAAPVHGDTDKAIAFLTQLGYLRPSSWKPSFARKVDESSFKRALAEFQSFVGLNVTGELDEETIKRMSLPRCGVHDKVFGKRRAKRYAIKQAVSQNKKLTYKISKYPSGSQLPEAEVDEEIARAFSMWAASTDFSFTRKTSGDVDIEIRFVYGDHGDGEPFDGRDGILAHAFYPAYGSDVHFDDAEDWTKNTTKGRNLFQAAVHEFGHALGLGHSNATSAVMQPFVSEFDPNYRLSEDDIKGIQALYKKIRFSHSRKSSGTTKGKIWLKYQ